MTISGLHGFFYILIAYAHTQEYTLKIEKNPINPDIEQSFLHIKPYPGSSIGGVF